MQKIKKLLKNKRFQAFMLSFLLGLIITLPNIILGSGIYSLFADLNIQEIPFNKYVNESIKNGSVLWAWGNELGSNFIGTFSFYNLTSPFNIIGYFFPSDWFKYLLGPIFILKYAVAGFTSYMFMERYVKNKNYALIGSLLYAFSGFQLSNTLFYHFHDVVAFFPLMLYALDRLVYDNKKGIFLLTTSLCLFTNWFFFVGEVVFAILYFLIKLITKEYKVSFKKFLTILLEGFLGVGIAAFILLPTIYFTLGNPRLSNGWTPLSMLVHNDRKIYIEILKAFVLPGEVMHPRAILYPSYYNSLDAYLPLFGIVLVIPYMINNKKSWPTILMLVSAIFMLIPILNSTFFALRDTYYARWYYMPLLIISLMSALKIKKKYKLQSGLITTTLLYIFIILGLLYKQRKQEMVIFQETYFKYMVIAALVCLIIVAVLNLIKNENKKIISYITAIFIFIGIWGNYMVYTYKSKTFETSEGYLIYLKYDDNGKFDNVRTNSGMTCYHNYGYIDNTNNIRAFNSNLNGSNFKFYYSIDYFRGVSTYINPDNIGLNDFLGVKYFIDCGDKNLDMLGYKYIDDISNTKIYYNPDYKKFGFALNDYILNDDFKKLGTTEKTKTLNEKIVFTKKQELKYKYLFNDVKPKYKYNKFKFEKNGFSSKIYSNKETLAIYTVPYDEGWTATINGKVTSIEDVDNGMMAIKINKGKNDIKFKYMPKGLKTGIVISVISTIITIIYFIRIKHT